ncbi:MAG: hypothetical protein AAGA05_06945 [Pseudomonadota bacterium]
MDPTLFLSVYGAVVSTLLAGLQLNRFISEKRFISVRFRTCFHKQDITLEIWIMNRSSSAVTLHYVDAGTFVNGRWPWKKNPECFLSQLENDAAGEPNPITLGPGESTKFTVSAVTLHKQFLDHVEILTSFHGEGKVKFNNPIQGLEIEHSRSDKMHTTFFRDREVTTRDLSDFLKRQQT